jgi:predicted transcriptional regulator
MQVLIVLQDVGTSFTIRLSESQREALRKRAKAMKTSESAWVRHIIEKDLEANTLQEQLDGLLGSLDSKRGQKRPKINGLKATIRERNWRR